MLTKHRLIDNFGGIDLVHIPSINAYVEFYNTNEISRIGKIEGVKMFMFLLHHTEYILYKENPNVFFEEDEE